MSSSQDSFLLRVAAFGAVGIISILVFLRGIYYPPEFFWDENYYLPPAQRYLNGIFFMESHPPLGKLLIASGEAITKPNASTTQFIDTDYAKDPPEGFNFTGYRAIPAVCAALVAWLLFGIFVEISGSALRAACFSALYLFDNAIIVHSRGAMLEGIQLFFICGAVLAMLRVRCHGTLTMGPLLMGAFFGCALATKENAIFVAPLLALPLWHLNGLLSRLRFVAISGASAVLAVLMAWLCAFSLSREVNPKLENDGWYAASTELKEAVRQGSHSPVALYYFIRDSLRYAQKYHSKVPRLNYCKPDENGSYPLLWPLGARSINYRWERLSDGSARYLFLQANPVVWAVALVGVLAGLSMISARFIGMHHSVPIDHADLIGALVASYCLYLAATLNVDRVFYLYHYFIPLILCFLMAQILFESLPSIGGISLNDSLRNMIAAMMAILALAAFLLYKPLTYYEPITDAALSRLRLLSLWDLIPIDGSKTNPFARPLTLHENAQARKKWTLLIGSLESISVSQSWGEPQTGRTVDGQPLKVAGQEFSSGFGVHADSHIKFPTARKYSRFKAQVGLPDEVKDKEASIIFKVLGDGRELWSSGPLRGGEPARAVELDISAVETLTLEAISASTSIDHAHACWLSPALIPLP